MLLQDTVDYYIWGWGNNTKAAARYLLKLQESGDNKRLQAIICKNQEKRQIEAAFLNQRITCLSPEQFLQKMHLEKAQRERRVIVSPGLAPSDPHYTALRSFSSHSQVRIQSAFELGLEGFKGKVIAVTGSNGKSTAVTMLSHCFNGCGYRSMALGNIGLSVCEYFLTNSKESLDYIVLELSSFQLYHYSLHAESKGNKRQLWDIACILNISANHLDWHQDMEQYVAAKAQILTGLKKGGALWLDPTARAKIIEQKSSLKDRYLKKALESYYPIKTELKKCSLELDWNNRSLSLLQQPQGQIQGQIQGQPMKCEKLSSLGHENAPRQDLKRSFYGHDACYIDWVLQVTHILGISRERAALAMLTYEKLAHRLEPVRELQGVLFINDSKATSLEAVAAALEAFSERPVHLLVGGRSKSLDYDCWSILLKDRNIRKVYCFGECAGKIAKAIQSTVEVDQFCDLEQALHSACSCVKKGDCVLLSPGCSSFDQYTNFEKRGESFKKMVLGLASLSNSG